MRAHILKVAFDEIRTQTFQGVSVNEIIEKAAITKGAFFHYFATKQDLGYAIVDEVLSETILDTWIKPLAAYQNPVEGIARTLKKVIEAMPEDALAAGCPLNNLTQEMSAVDAVFRDKLLAITMRWISEIERCLQLAQARGYLTAECDVRQLAEFVVTLHTGSVGLAKAMQDKCIMRSLHNSLKMHLDHLSVAPVHQLAAS